MQLTTINCQLDSLSCVELSGMAMHCTWNEAGDNNKSVMTLQNPDKFLVLRQKFIQDYKS